MNKAQLQDQIAPGSVGLALSTIWMTYGEAGRFVPTDLTEVKYAALTAALGVVFTALVNVIRRFTTGAPVTQYVDIPAHDDGSRASQTEDTES